MFYEFKAIIWWFDIKLFALIFPICLYLNPQDEDMERLELNLHSNMSLLNYTIHLATYISFRFTFQYVSILIQTRRWTRYDFKEIYIPICFYFNNYCILQESRWFYIYIPICFYFNPILPYFYTRLVMIYIPICFYFNPSPEFLLLFYLISPLSVDQPKFTNILPYLLH